MEPLPVQEPPKTDTPPATGVDTKQSPITPAGAPSPAPASTPTPTPAPAADPPAEAQTEHDPEPKKHTPLPIKKTAPKADEHDTPRNSSVTAAIIATVVIVIVLALIALYAFMQSR